MSPFRTPLLFCCVLAANSVPAETYDGVHALTTQRGRAEVGLEALAASRLPNPYAESALALVAPISASSMERHTVEQQAFIAAHAPNQNLEPQAFFKSVIPAQFNGSAINGHIADDSPVISRDKQSS